MCVIIVKPAKANAPTANEMRNAMIVNPHGFSISWAKNGVLTTFKTLSRDEMITYYNEHLNDFKEASFVFHARIATHGEKTLENCHGWRTLENSTAFYHNGVLDIETRRGMTDSETFLRDIFEPVHASRGWEGARKAIRAIIGTSKFAFIDNLGKIRLYGDFTRYNGLLYSNTHHLFRGETRTWGYNRANF